MPFLQSIETPWGVTGIWKMTEPAGYFSDQISLEEDETVEYGKLGTERRRREYFVIRKLINELTGKNLRLRYKADGRPFLQEIPLKISVSHSSDLAAVFLSKYTIGIDVETQGRNICKISKKYLSDIEMENIAAFPDQELGMLIHWCSKEAVFKCSRQKRLDFRSQIRILPFSLSEGEIFDAQILTGGKTESFRLNYQKLENNVLVWCVKK